MHTHMYGGEREIEKERKKERKRFISKDWLT